MASGEPAPDGPGLETDGAWTRVTVSATTVTVKSNALTPWGTLNAHFRSPLVPPGARDWAYCRKGLSPLGITGITPSAFESCTFSAGAVPFGFPTGKAP